MKKKHSQTETFEAFDEQVIQLVINFIITVVSFGALICFFICLFSFYN